MYSQHELAKFSTYAERMHRLAFDIAMQAAQLGAYGSKVAFVADECRNIGVKLQVAADRLYDGEEVYITECLLQMESMALNGCTEALKIDELDRSGKSTKPLAVIFDEILSLIKDIRTFFQIPTPAPPIHAGVLPKSSVLSKRMPFLHMTIGGQGFVENLQFVQEIFRYGNIKDGKVVVRGTAINVIDTGKILDSNAVKAEFLVIINMAEQPESCVALPVDCLPSIRWNDIGVPAKAASTLPKTMIRECWGCEENQQMLFLNYKGM